MDDNRLGDFLHARRDQVTPEEVGLPSLGGRRVPGLRREELASVAGVSPTYYVRIEQGHSRNPSPQVLDALADALRLDAEARRHLHALAAPAGLTGSSPAGRAERVRPELARLLDHQVDAPAFVLGRSLDVLAANALAQVLHPSFRAGRNVVRDAFLDQPAQASYADLERARRNAVGSLHAAAGSAPDDPRITELVGELSLKSDAFRRLWARHEVRSKIAGTKHFAHPDLGEIELDYESLGVTGGDRQQLIIYHADPGGPQAQALALLRTLAAERRLTSPPSAPAARPA
jgi:transcriptional regulator with XRE-family HTH domain